MRVGGVRCTVKCPDSGKMVRDLYLLLGRDHTHFRSRHALYIRPVLRFELSQAEKTSLGTSQKHAAADVCKASGRTVGRMAARCIFEPRSVAGSRCIGEPRIGGAG